MTPTEPESLIMEALLARLSTFVASPAVPVSWPGKDFTPPADRKYLRVKLLPNRPVRLFIGSDDPERHIGIFQVTVVWPVGEPEIAARELAGEVADWFKSDLNMPAGDFVVRSYQRPRAGTSIPDGADLLTPVSVFYESYI